jgi:hypothetical protein
MIVGPQAKREEAEATLDGLRRLEDRFLRLILGLTPEPCRKGLAQAITGERFRGLTKLIGGVVVAAPLFLVLFGLGMLTGVYVTTAAVGIPLAVSMVGLMEIVLGVGFTDLERRFAQGGFFLKIGIILVVLSFVALYFSVYIFIYRFFVN